MLVNHYLPKILTALFGGLFLFGCLYSFGNPFVFDRIFIGVFVFTAIVCRNNVNVLGVVAILILQRLLEETAWSISELDYQYIVKPIFYLVAVYAYWSFKYDPISKVLLAALIISLGAEFYWQYNDINPPQIYWYTGVIVSSLFVRHLLFVRVSYTSDLFPKQAESINLDWGMHKINGITPFIQLLNIVEFIVRNVTRDNSILYVYTAYPYVLQIIAGYAVWLVFYESYRLLLPKLLKV